MPKKLTLSKEDRLAKEIARRLNGMNYVAANSILIHVNFILQSNAIVATKNIKVK